MCLVDATQDIAITLTQCEFELRARPFETAMTAGRGFHFEPHVTTIVGHREDVVVSQRVRLRCPDDPSFRIPEGLDSLKLGAVDKFLTAGTNRLIRFLFVRGTKPPYAAAPAAGTGL